MTAILLKVPMTKRITKRQVLASTDTVCSLKRTLVMTTLTKTCVGQKMWIQMSITVMVRNFRAMK